MSSAMCNAIFCIACCLSVLFPLTGSVSASSFKVIHTFQNNGDTTDGGLPQGQLVRDIRGNLYGTTLSGGAYGSGTVFELSPHPNGTWSESILYSFTGGADGGLPVAGLVFDDDGNLYGTAQQGGFFGGPCYVGSYGCGVVFELSPSARGWTYILLYNFAGGDGAGPAGTLVLDGEGNLYGTTLGGGYYRSTFCFGGCGVAFELVRGASWHEKVLHTFSISVTDGANPTGGLVLDRNGNLYGTTLTGGWNNGGSDGTVYKLTPTVRGPWTETILYGFCSQYDCADGNAPTGAPLLHNGTLYGATSHGGKKGGSGTVFKLTNNANGWRLSEFSFAGTDGQTPIAPVLLRDRYIFGVTQQGGIVNGACVLYPNGNGVVYELAPKNGVMTETVLYEFTGGSDGCGPSAGLLADSDGRLYGTTFESGLGAGGGVVFEVIP